MVDEYIGCSGCYLLLNLKEPSWRSGEKVYCSQCAEDKGLKPRTPVLQGILNVLQDFIRKYQP